MKDPKSPSPVIIGGVDTHKELHVAAVVDATDTVLATESLSTTRAGYRAMLRWMRSYGDIARVGVECEVVPLPVELRWRSTWSSGGDHGFIMSHGSDSFGGDVRVEGGA